MKSRKTAEHLIFYFIHKKPPFPSASGEGALKLQQISQILIDYVED